MEPYFPYFVCNKCKKNIENCTTIVRKMVELVKEIAFSVAQIFLFA